MAKKSNKIDVKIYDGAIAPKVTAGRDATGPYVTITDASGSNTTRINDGEKGDTGDTGPEGTLFVPSVDAAGNISWTNTGGKENPETRNIKGPQGIDGVIFTPAVDDNGNISWTNDGGKENPPTKNIKGPQGIQGVDGPQGVKGDTGEPFSIKWVAPSYAALIADTTHCSVGEMAVIASSVEDPHNAELYVRVAELQSETGYYKFLTDMSGATGIQGPQGPQGIQGPQGVQGNPGTNGKDGVSVMGVTISGAQSQYLNIVLSSGAVSTVDLSNAYEYIIQEVIRRIGS